MMRRVALALIGVVLLCAPATALPQGGGSFNAVSIYVATTGNDSNAGTIGSPYLTASKAKSAAVTALAAGQCPTVYFRGGTYPVTSTLAFTSSDSGSSGCTVTWQSYPAENAILSGGVALTGTFSLCTTADAVCNSGAGGVYQSSTTLTALRELYVNGTHRERARSTDGVTVTGWTQTSGGYSLSSSNFTPLSTWKNLTHVEVIIAGGGATSASVPGWEQIRCTIGSVSGSAVTMGTPCWTLFKGLQSATWGAWTTLWWLENAYEMLPACGQGCWYYDYTAQIVYYIPKTGETISTIPVVAPQLTQLATFSGASYLSFTRLQFSHATFLPDSAGDDYMSIQNGYYATGVQNGGIGCGAGTCVNFTNTTEMGAALTFTSGSNHITFSHDLFAHNGGRSLFFGHGSQYVTISASLFTDNGGGGIQWGEGSDYAQTNPALETTQLLYQNNEDDGPFEYLDSGAFFGLITSYSTIDHNYFPATGWAPLTLGYGYSIPTVEANYATNNSITNNNIVAPCQLMFDCGDIYIAGGAEPNLTVSGNYGQNTGNTTMRAAVYPDDGTTDTTWSGNVFAPGGRSSYWAFLWTVRTVRNTLSGNYTTTATNNYINADTNTFTGTTQYTAGSPPAPVIAIIANAGIQSGVTPGP